MRDVLHMLQSWSAQGLKAAVATVVGVERSAPRQPGSVLALNERGEVAGSVTGGCVEPAVHGEAEEVLAGGAPRLVTYGISDEEGFEVGLSCGGTVHIFIEPLDMGVVDRLAAEVAQDRPAAVVTRLAGERAGGQHVVTPADAPPEIGEMIALDRTGRLVQDDGELFVSVFAPRPEMYVFGAIDHAAAVARVGRLLGYRVTVCDARATFVTPERFPDVDELVIDWPHDFLATAPVDRRTAICVLTHDPKFDVPVLKAALATEAGYIGAMGSRRTTATRAERLVEEGVEEGELSRIHAPIGLDIGARTPEEVAVAVGAQIVSVVRSKEGGRSEAAARV